MTKSDFYALLRCPDCHGNLDRKGDSFFCCTCGRKFEIMEGTPLLLPKKLPKEQGIAIKAWGKTYRGLQENGNFEYINHYTLADVQLIHRFAYPIKEGPFLELGCGTASDSFILAKEGISVVGLDISFDALSLARKVFQKGKESGFFVCGDIENPPFETDFFEVIFAGGSLEHLKDTERAVLASYSLLKKRGKLIVTVPCVSLATLTQGLVTGNIPEIPILKEIYSFMHFFLLGEKRLMYGYEKSFRRGQIEAVFKRTGFSGIKIGFYEVEYTLKYVKGEIPRKLVRRLIKIPIFWPMVYVVGEKR